MKFFNKITSVAALSLMPLSSALAIDGVVEDNTGGGSGSGGGGGGGTNPSGDQDTMITNIGTCLNPQMTVT